jgi:hypothetical protein
VFIARVCNTSPFLASVIPTFKYHIRNIIRQLLPFFFFIIIIPAYIKNKQAITFGYRIENSNNAIEIISCFFYVSLDHKYIFDQKLFEYYSEYYYYQTSCDSLSDK